MGIATTRDTRDIVTSHFQNLEIDYGVKTVPSKI